MQIWTESPSPDPGHGEYLLRHCPTQGLPEQWWKGGLSVGERKLHETTLL